MDDEPMQGRLEAMDLDVFLLAHGTINEELGDLLTMVTLELDNIHPAILVLDNTAITGKILLENFQDLLRVNILRETFNGGQSFTSITLMQTDI